MQIQIPHVPKIRIQFIPSLHLTKHWYLKSSFPVEINEWKCHAGFQTHKKKTTATNILELMLGYMEKKKSVTILAI